MFYRSVPSTAELFCVGTRLFSVFPVSTKTLCFPQSVFSFLPKTLKADVIPGVSEGCSHYLSETRVVLRLFVLVKYLTEQPVPYLCLP